jgi:hypothetical protein
MDLQTRKLNAIEYLINLQDEKVFIKIESIIASLKSQKDCEVKPFSKKQLIDRAKQSDQDYLSGKFKTQEQLEMESENW